MQYRAGKHGQPISLLGYGCMRFSRKGTAIDIDKAEAEVMAAIRAGVNFLDTAYIYPGSEVAVGEILRRNNCRDQVYLCDKLPHYLVRSIAGIEKSFQDQLRRLGTDYIDFYLMHMLSSKSSWDKLVELGIEDWIREKKASGAIRNIGFSFHGNTASFLEVLEAYDWDACLIQYNYMDETSQAGRKGVEAAYAKGIPVIIMEPLRGGRLVNGLPDSAHALLREQGQNRSAAEWALRWLWDQPGVTCVLSGMNSMEMVEENCRIASEVQPHEMTEADLQLIAGLRREISRAMRVGCTGCGYCLPCPRGVDIPGAFHCWNETQIDSPRLARLDYLKTTALRRPAASASLCINCGKCEQHCPQNLPIRQLLADAAKELETPLYKLAVQAYRILKL